MNLTAFVRLLGVFLFVLSVSFNIKFYLDNQVMIKLLVVEDNGLNTKSEVKRLVNDLHIINKMDENISILKLGDKNSSKEQF